ncbi:C-type lectin lectoxin-Enh4-like [Trachemys scripta elegans]|uniref:C-type lectin lectoxin-Enh4-like n=1 Tax=Trachemys scripta elegans TaxID=31138 RepID=UPI001554A25C|nr:C-type lectin lectoxin-Enh4-like [Trachemys scripta elegans]
MPRVRPVSHAGCTWTGLAPEQLPSETIRGSEKMGPVAYFSLCLLGCLIFNPLLEGVQGVVCPGCWLPFHDSCYRYVPQEKNWLEAEADCQQHWPGAHLASIHSAEEKNMLAHYIKGDPTKKNHVWIGLSDPDHDQTWRWSDDSSFNFRAWDKGQPNHGTEDEHCTVLFYDTAWEAATQEAVEKPLAVGGVYVPLELLEDLGA